jgi:hypothetical protein
MAIATMSRAESRHVCRIVDTNGGLAAGTVVLVSDKGGAFGYALTCWHNFDPDHQRSISQDEILSDVFLIPNWCRVDEPDERRPVTVVGQWSNKDQDVAVLKVPRSVIDQFGLEPMPVTRDLRPSLKLAIVGFHRPGELRDSERVLVTAVSGDVNKDVKDWRVSVRVFEVCSADGRAVPFDVGMSGGAIFEPRSGALVGLAAQVDPTPTGSHRLRGYGTSIDTVTRGWPTMADHCVFVRIDSDVLKWWLSAIAALALLLVLVFGGVYRRYGPRVPDIAPPHTPPPATIRTPSAQTTVFDVRRYYVPTGLVGDVGDLKISLGGGEGNADLFIYETLGRGPHEWEWKYEDGVLKRNSARFAGIVYLSPTGCWGLTADCGWNLRGFRRVRWDARTRNEGIVHARFSIGTDNWTWARGAGRQMQKLPVPFPGTWSVNLGDRSLDRSWHSFVVDLSDQDLSRVIGGFGWSVEWSSNGVETNDEGRAGNPKKLEIEIRNILYER